MQFANGLLVNGRGLVERRNEVVQDGAVCENAENLVVLELR